MALLLGLGFGGLMPETFAPIKAFTSGLLQILIALVPLLVFVALSPSVATLIRRGLAGRFALWVILWYFASSILAGLFGLLVAALVFDMPFGDIGGKQASAAIEMLGDLRRGGSVAWPLAAIAGALLFGLAGAFSNLLHRWLMQVQNRLHQAGAWMGYAVAPLILLFGITIGVTFGARFGLGHYLTIVIYTFSLCACWWAFYVFGLVRPISGKPTGRLLKEYYAPTALFAAGTCSSLAALPVNLYNAKKYGVRDEVADFVIPFGAVANMDASALAYLAYGPFVTIHVFGLEANWVMMLIAWPVLVVYSMAAPGLPAGMGTALWSSVLFASMLGLEDPDRSDFVATWVALSGGIPDMFRAATNSTGDGFAAVIFDSLFDRMTSR